jgi:KaiC/GvpD/RAD55 family RecA-like ATPase
MSESLPMGVNKIDEQMGGGVELGSLVTFQAPPASQSDLFLYHIIDGKDVTYVTAHRSKECIKEELSRKELFNTENVLVVEIEPTATNIHKTVKTIIKDSGSDLVVVDKINPIENTDGYLHFLRELQDILRSTGTVCYFYRVNESTKGEKETQSVSDYVFELKVQYEGSEIINKFIIPKARFGPTVNEIIKVDLDGEVTVDTSRDIA